MLEVQVLEAFGAPAVERRYEPEVKEDPKPYKFIAVWEDAIGVELTTVHYLTTNAAAEVFRQIRLERIDRGYKGYSLVDLIDDSPEPF